MKKDGKNYSNEFIDKLSKVIRKCSIRSRLTIFFMLSLFLSFFSMGTWIYHQTSETLYKNLNGTIKTINEQTASYISKKIQKVISDSIEISNMEIVQKMLKQEENFDSVQLYQAKKTIIQQMSNRFIFNDLISEITLYTLDGKRINLYGPYGYRFKPTEAEWNMLVAQSDSAANNLLYAVNANNSMILFREVKDKENGEKIGYILMRINEDNISDMYPETLSGVGSESFIINSEGLVVSSKNNNLLANHYGDKDFTKLVTQTDFATQTDITQRINGDIKIVNHASIKGTDWTFISIVSKSVFKIDTVQFRIKLLLSIIVCFVMVIIISWIVAQSILHPLDSIVWAMKKNGDGENDIYIIDDGNDEFTFLSEEFNKMSYEIKCQMQNIRESEKQKLKLEIQALQAQINPHFIANTLNLISNIAVMNGEEAIEKLSDSLVDLLRDCIQNDERFIKVSDEISMLQSYINIQEFRMLGKFKLQMQIESEINEYLVPHLILQPVVENALLHGFSKEKRAQGLISIRGYMEQESIIFTIMDNGKGMTSSQIEEVLSGKYKTKEKGRFNSIGIWNIQQRLHLLFGKEYGLSISSLPDVYTTVTIRVPLISDQEE